MKRELNERAGEGTFVYSCYNVSDKRNKLIIYYIIANDIGIKQEFQDKLLIKNYRMQLLLCFIIVFVIFSTIYKA